MSTVRIVGIAIGSLVMAALVIALVGGVVPKVLGSATDPVLAIVLGGFIFRDIVRRDAARVRATSASA